MIPLNPSSPRREHLPVHDSHRNIVRSFIHLLAQAHRWDLRPRVCEMPSAFPIIGDCSKTGVPTSRDMESKEGVEYAIIARYDPYVNSTKSIIQLGTTVAHALHLH